jgi:hypothetical protein
MNDTENETVRFSMKPNPVFYALEFTRHALLMGTVVGISICIPLIWPGIYSERGVVLLLMTYALLGLPLFIVAFVAACHLMFVVTDKRAIVRFSFWRMTMDGLSIAIESVRHIAINSCGATYGSVYLTYEKTSPCENPKDSEPDDPRPGSIRRAHHEATRASVPIKRTNSIWVSMNNPWPRLLGFYGFKGFDEFANIISDMSNKNPLTVIVHLIEGSERRSIKCTVMSGRRPLSRDTLTCCVGSWVRSCLRPLCAEARVSAGPDVVR